MCLKRIFYNLNECSVLCRVIGQIDWSVMYRPNKRTDNFALLSSVLDNYLIFIAMLLMFTIEE